MTSPFGILWKRYEKWLRLITLVHHAGKEICYKLLFIERKLPTNGELLYEFLEINKERIKPDKNQKVVLYPQNRNTDISEFDVSLYTKVIQGLYGWYYQDLLKNLRMLRNRLFHKGRTKLTVEEFRDLWEEASNILESHKFNMESVAGLKECDFDQLEEYKKPLRNGIDGVIQGNEEEWFVFFFNLFYLSKYLIFRNLQDIFFSERVKDYKLLVFSFLESTADSRP